MLRAFKKYGWIVGSCILGVIILLVTSKSEPKKAIVVNDDTPPSESSSTEEPVPPMDEQYVFVDVKGEVKQPGVYDVDVDYRIDDVISLAGGLTEEADELHVNKAQKVHDEMVIYVPAIGETDAELETSSVSTNENVVRLNYATKEDITELPGIGPSKADAIIQYRDENGSFTSVEDLLHVSGIGEKTLESLREYIQVP